jgi:DNA processing protein
MKSTSNGATYVLALKKIRGLGPERIIQLLKYFPDPDVLRSIPVREVANRLGPGTSKKMAGRISIELSAFWGDAEQAVKDHLQRKVLPIPIVDRQYPPLLRLISDPPPIIFASGNVSILSETESVAVVGTRRPTELGTDMAHQIAFRLASERYMVVSGLAKGIDTAAHLGALEASGKTIAVLGTPLDDIYPRENQLLAEHIAKSGALVSELAFGTPPSRTTFIRRDRIQSGLAIAVFAIQTGLTGGTMHTVTFAKRQGRLLFCPKPPAIEVMCRQNAGILRLLRSGRALKLGTEYHSLFRKLTEQHERLKSMARKSEFNFVSYKNGQLPGRGCRQLDDFIT